MGVFKAGDRAAAVNYRPMALTSHLSNILERVVRKDIVNYLTENNLWDPRQHGSRGSHSTLSQLLTHYDYILENLEIMVQAFLFVISVVNIISSENRCKIN